MRVRTRVAVREGSKDAIERLLRTAERCCVVGQTLRHGVAIEHERAN